MSPAGNPPVVRWMRPGCGANVIGETSIPTHPGSPDMGSSEADALLDVREVDGEPFDDIMDALEGLGDGERLRLVAPFEPEPLYGVLDQRGFDHETAQVTGDEWHVDISRA